jgi:transposase
LSYIQGESRQQQSLFPPTLDDFVPADHVCRVIEAFVDKLDMGGLGFQRAEPADTGRPGYDPRDLLKLYLYGYLHQVRSSRRLEAECRRNVEVMWLLGRLSPDYKSIAEFRRMHSEAVTKAGAELVRMARQVGLVRGEWVAIDGSKFRAVSSAGAVGEREAVRRYLDQMNGADEQDEVTIDPSAVAAAIEKLNSDPEPEARFMRMSSGHAPAYNVQTAVDAAYGIIVAHEVTTEATDNRSLLPMAEAAKRALDNPEMLNVVADAGYSNGEQAERCEEQGIVPHAPANRSINNQGDGHAIRPLVVYLRREDGHLPLSGKSNAHAQTSDETQEDGAVCSLSRRLLPMPAETAMYYGRTPLVETTPA